MRVFNWYGLMDLEFYFICFIFYGNLFKCYENTLSKIFSSVNLTIHLNKKKGSGLSGSELVNFS